MKKIAWSILVTGFILFTWLLCFAIGWKIALASLGTLIGLIAMAAAGAYLLNATDKQ